MVKAVQMFVGIVVLAGMLAGCQSMTGQTAGEYADDAGITAAVKTKLANNQVSSLSRVDVETVNGVVHLMGVVKSDADKSTAVRLAKEVKGVRRVDNDLSVQME
jgi:hyperosmotically inducible protein